MTVFCKKKTRSVRRSRYCLEISLARERLIISRRLFHPSNILGDFLLASLRFSEVGFSAFQSPSCFFYYSSERTPNLFGFENNDRKRYQKISPFRKPLRLSGN